MKVENLDHRGIVAGLIDEIGIVELINEKLGTDSREKVSTGVVVKAMLLNGLGCVSAPLYLFEQFFQGKAIEHLLGEGVKAEYLNDDRLGKALDEVYELGLSEIFVLISLQGTNRFGVVAKSAHLDSTSFHVEGEYEETRENAEPRRIEITYGYSRDHRPDLKQFVMNLVCVGEGDIPVWMEMASGNQSDKARFAKLLKEFKEQWTFEGLCVADGALYSEDNLKTMGGIQWLTRVPLSIKEASQLIKSKEELQASVIEGYKIAEFDSNYGEVAQRWLLIESEQRRLSDLKQLKKKIEQYRQKCQKEYQELSNRDFACAADAISAAQQLSQKMTWHELSGIQVVEKRHYNKAGKSRQDEIPKHLSYRVTATVIPRSDDIETQQTRCGRFILATPVRKAHFFSHSSLSLSVFYGCSSRCCSRCYPNR